MKKRRCEQEIISAWPQAKILEAAPLSTNHWAQTKEIARWKEGD